MAGRSGRARTPRRGEAMEREAAARGGAAHMEGGGGSAHACAACGVSAAVGAWWAGMGHAPVAGAGGGARGLYGAHQRSLRRAHPAQPPQGVRIMVCSCARDALGASRPRAVAAPQRGSGVCALESSCVRPTGEAAAADAGVSATGGRVGASVGEARSRPQTNRECSATPLGRGGSVPVSIREESAAPGL